MKRLYLTTAVLCLLFTAGLSQEENLRYSQYKFNGLAINPAYAGSHEVFSASFMNRMQWVGMEGAPVYQNLNFHFPGKKTKTGWGGNILHESTGLWNNYSLFANYAYRIPMKRGNLAMGMKVGLISGKRDMPELVEANDPVYAGDNQSYLLPNFGIGIYYYTGRYYAGFSMPLMLGKKANNGTMVADLDFSKRTYCLTGGYYFYPDPDWRLSPSLLALYTRSTGPVADVTLNALYKETIGAALSYRTSKALIMMLSYRIGYQTTVGVAYDFGFGEIRENNRNTSSFEIGLQVDLGFKINRSNPTIF